jgi:hypothetical protein
VQADDVLRDLLALSTQVRKAVVLGGSGFVVGCSTAPERGEALARAATELLTVAEEVRPGAPRVTRVEVLDRSGGFFVVRDEQRVVAATTVSDATPALVVYDLRTALGRLAERGRSATPDHGAEAGGGDA